MDKDLEFRPVMIELDSIGKLSVLPGDAVWDVVVAARISNTPSENVGTRVSEY